LELVIGRRSVALRNAIQDLELATGETFGLIHWRVHLLEQPSEAAGESWTSPCAGSMRGHAQA
jgi:hypothetical protein